MKKKRFLVIISIVAVVIVAVTLGSKCIRVACCETGCQRGRVGAIASDKASISGYEEIEKRVSRLYDDRQRWR